MNRLKITLLIKRMAINIKVLCSQIYNMLSIPEYAPYVEIGYIYIYSVELITFLYCILLYIISCSIVEICPLRLGPNDLGRH